MASQTRQRYVLGIGLACMSLLGLAGCGTSSATAPPSATEPSAPSALSSPEPSSSPIVGALCIPTSIAFDPESIDLTGTWAADDGGVYYVRQLDSVVWWNGMSERDEPPALLGREWNNVGRGEIQGDLSIVSEWADVPRGRIGGSGTVNFQIGADAAGNLQITKTSETGAGRGDTLWTPCTLGFPG